MKSYTIEAATIGANHVTLIFLTNSIYGSPYDTYVSTLAMAITAPPYKAD